MTEYKKVQLTLPDDVRVAFETIGEDLDTRNLYIAKLRGLGWTLQSVSEVTGITRERVRQIAVSYAGEVSALPGGLPLPTPPLKPVKTPKVYTEPDPGKLARLLTLQPLAQQNRASSEEFRVSAEQYTALVWEVHNDDGVPLYRLAKRLGVTHGALRFRLARYGYKLPGTGKSKVYTRIDPNNRVAV